MLELNRHGAASSSHAANVVALAIVGCVSAASLGCSSSTAVSNGGDVDGGTEAAAPADPADAAAPVGGDRPVAVHVPPSYVAGKAMPLVILLHGYTASGDIQESYFQLKPLADERGFLYATPDGTTDVQGNRFWNATDACCNLGGKKVDDSAYLAGVIDAIAARYTVDPKRVYLVGHSNGGFMSHRMACDHADKIAAIASLAGATFTSKAKCKATEPVAVLQIHGTKDARIAYEGGDILGNTFPSAKKTVETWAEIDGCSLTADESASPLDLESTLAGKETTITKYATGCKPGGHAELWTVTDGAHVPTLSASFAPSVIDFLFAHPKP